jgi:hypothetical protein
VIVYCRNHARSIGAVTLAPGGFPQFSTRHPRWRDRFASQAGINGRDNELTNLRVAGGGEVQAWCPSEQEPRFLSVAALLAAFGAGSAKIQV